MIADSPLIGKIILILVLIAIDAFCSCAEIAVISLDASELEKMAEEKNKKAERLLKFLSELFASEHRIVAYKHCHFIYIHDRSLPIILRQQFRNCR